MKDNICLLSTTKIIAFFSLTCIFKIYASPITNPLRADGDISKVIPDYFDSKTSTRNFHNSTPHILKEVPLISYNSPDPDCNVGFKLAWSANVGSSVYASPVVFPSGSEGKRQIFLSTFFQHIEIVGHDGYKPQGWPLSFEDSTFQGSPMLYDIDGDGTNDVGVVDKNGNLFWVRIGEYGQYLEDYHIQVPKLKIKRDWAVGLDPKFSDNYVMMSMFDHKSDRDNREKYSYASNDGKPLFSKKEDINDKSISSGKVKQDILGLLPIKQETYPMLNKFNEKKGDLKGGDNSNGAESKTEPLSMGSGSRRLLSVEETLPEEEKAGAVTEADTTSPIHEVKPLINIGTTRHQEEKHHIDTPPAQVDAIPNKHTDVQEDTTHQLDSLPAHVVANSTDTNPIDLEKKVAMDHVEENTLVNHHIEKDDHHDHEQHFTEQEKLEFNSHLHEMNGGTVDKDKGGREMDEVATDSEEEKREEEENSPFLRPEGEEGDDYVQPSSMPGEEGEDREYGNRYGGRRRGGRGGRSFDDGMMYSYGGRGGGMYNDTDFVYVDAHVLGSPVLSDVDGDGHVEVLVAVSYYFDKEEYAGKKLDFDPSMYIGGGLACWDLKEQDWSWLVHLDQSTEKTKFKSLIYSTPTVADLDGDGRSEIVIGTSMGLLYVLDGGNGFVKRYFPMQFHEIQAQVAVSDVTGGAGLEIIVADMGGTLALVDFDGEILWDVNLSGTLPHTPTVGDVDGDGQLDIAVVAASSDGSSHLWVVRGDTGKTLEGYPMALPKDAIASASVLLIDLHDYTKEAQTKVMNMKVDKALDPSMLPWMGHTLGYEPPPTPIIPTTPINDTRSDGNSAPGGKKGDVPPLRRKGKGLHILVPSFEGHIYVIDGFLKCAERIDIGEHIYSTPLMDDITGNGYLDLVVGTLNGQVHLLETTVPYHPLNSWASYPKGRLNGFTANVMGVSVPLAEKRSLSRQDIIRRDHHRRKSRKDKDGNTEGITGEGLMVTFDIWDERDPSKVQDRKYKVQFTRGTNKQDPMATHEYTAPGRYTVELPLYPPEKFLLVIGLTNEHGQYFEESVHIAMSTRFYVWIKYLIMIPLCLLYIPLLMMRKKPKMI